MGLWNLRFISKVKPQLSWLSSPASRGRLNCVSCCHISKAELLNCIPMHLFSLHSNVLLSSHALEVIFLLLGKTVVAELLFLNVLEVKCLER